MKYCKSKYLNRAKKRIKKKYPAESFTVDDQKSPTYVSSKNQEGTPKPPLDMRSGFSRTTLVNRRNILQDLDVNHCIVSSKMSVGSKSPKSNPDPENMIQEEGNLMSPNSQKNMIDAAREMALKAKMQLSTLKVSTPRSSNVMMLTEVSEDNLRSSKANYRSRNLTQDNGFM